MEGAVWCLVVAMALGSSGQGASPSYSVVAPSTIRPNTDYFAAITMGGITGDLQVSIGHCLSPTVCLLLFQEVQCRIFGRTKTGRNIEIQQSTRVPPGETQMVRLSIGELGEGSYRFEAKGISPMEFQDSTPLTYYHKGYSVFIQTDKAIYRPGNEVSSTPPGVTAVTGSAQVQFRVIVLSPRLKPSVTGSIGVSMSDGEGNLIRDWDRVFTTKVGVTPSPDS